MSAVSFFEASMVTMSRRGNEGIRDLDLFIAKASVDIRSTDIQQAHIARKAFRDFGKGRHPANLIFGECFSYALALSLGEPLLIKGNDFAKTDIDQVIAEQFLH